MSWNFKGMFKTKDAAKAFVDTQAEKPHCIPTSVATLVKQSIDDLPAPADGVTTGPQQLVTLETSGHIGPNSYGSTHFAVGLQDIDG